MEDWAEYIELKRYRGKQIFQWVYGKAAGSIDEMTNLSKEVRAVLAQKSYISNLSVVKRQVSTDGTEKYLFALEDGHSIESVLLPEEDRLTICISTQVGCGMGCAFCLTGKNGLERNLKSSEIINQFLKASEGLPQGKRITNVVIMGMGEPFANYNNVIKAVEILTNPFGANIGARRITISTSGLIPGMKNLGASGLNVNLAISLNASTDEQRSIIMPVNKKYPLAELLHACREFPLKQRKRISFEYVLIDGFNNSPEDAKRVARLLKGIRCKINLIPFNEFPGSQFKRPSESSVLTFQEILFDHNYTVFIRKSRGADILAACGQLHEE